MKLIKPSFDIWEQSAGLEGVYKQIELAGRTAYKSEDRITDTSAEKFVNMLIKRKHNAALEHGTIYLYITYNHHYPKNPNYLQKQLADDIALKYINNPYSNVNHVYMGGDYYITTNYRVIIENNWEKDLKYLVSTPCSYHEKRLTFKFVLSRGIANEFVRHRVFSFLQESTRYCNYSKDKFGGVSFISSIDCPLKLGEYTLNNDIDIIKDGNIYISNKEVENLSPEEAMLYAYCTSEQLYLSLLDQGVKPQIARDVLPLGLKTELVMTGTVKQWRDFLNLRCAPDAHPDARYLADRVKDMLGF